ncbi:MAG TPA: DUF4258 domain-containing protein [Candidatus Saccharimonadales bacterium]|nr:DUF4258 domain-containing protein [Candidatus Saccharimonadales bacterium]
MKQFRWNKDKNKLLQQKRNISFEDVLKAFDQGNVLDNIDHPNRNKFPNQKLFIVLINNYICAVPYVETEKEIFLKTIYLSRKYKNKYEKT